MEKLPDILPVNMPPMIRRALYGTDAPDEVDSETCEAEAFRVAVEVPNHWTEFVRKRDAGTLAVDPDETFAKETALPAILQRPYNIADIVIKAAIATPEVVAQRGAAPADVLAPFHALVKATLANGERSADEPEFVHPLEASKLAKRTEPDVEAAALEAAVWRTEQGTNETEGEFLARCATIAKGIVA